MNALIIGAGRSGTTSLYHLLAAHDKVCYSKVKEVPYFSIGDLFGRGEVFFHSFFRKCNGASVTITADTYLLMDHDAVSRVYAYNPEMKIMVMLRDPVARAYSSYHYAVNNGHHEAYRDFLDSIEAEKNIRQEPDIVRRNNFGHFYGSLYYEHLSKWAAVFPKEQILLLRTRDLSEIPKEFSSKLFAFLNLQDPALPVEKFNTAAVPRNMKLERFFIDRDHVLRRVIRKITPPFIKRTVVGSGIVDRLHEANRKEQRNQPMSSEQEREARNYFLKDLQLLKQEFQVDLIHSGSSCQSQPHSGLLR